MEQHLFLFLDSFINQLFFYSDKTSYTRSHQKFIKDMIFGIIGSRSCLLSNISRFLNEPTDLKHTHKRLARNLLNSTFPWEDLNTRSFDMCSRYIEKNDIIAFDPGDVSKAYAEKMDNLHYVHDGSLSKRSLGYEDFSVECIKWKKDKKLQLPLYHKMINASCDGYISQNHQILKAIEITLSNIPKGCGVWTFDRGHDRSILYTDAFLKKDFRWIVRIKNNRFLLPLEKTNILSLNSKKGVSASLLKKQISMTKTPSRLLFPKKSGDLYLGWIKVRLPFDKTKKPLSLVVVKDPRNKESVMFLTNCDVHDEVTALTAFGYYLERWGKEEGYRFCKSFLNLESLRTLRWASIEGVYNALNYAYLFLCLAYKEFGEQIEKRSVEVLKNFKHINKINYKYYRVAQVIQMIFAQHKGLGVYSGAMTQVG